MVTPRSGFDLEYYLARTAGEKTAGGYYLNAAQQGEPPGRWFGRGAEALGFSDGQLVERDPYLAVYQQRDPQTGEKLGRAPNGWKRFSEIFNRKLAAEPHATWERRLELEREAGQQARRSPVYTDLTVAHNKSISVLHASFREQARRAHLAGDAVGEAVWRGREERVQQILLEANRAALEYLEQQAGFVRTGYHGRRIDGREPGRWEAAGLVVTSWLQHTSRDGEPHDHIHNVVARMARTGSDGGWRAVDTMALRAQLGAFGAIQEVRVKSALAREFGVRWVARADGAGHEIAGIAQETLDAYSTRAHTVTQAQVRLAREWERKHGRAPNAREMQYLGLKANKVTRKGKEGEIDWDKLTAEWDATVGGQLAAVAENTCDFQAQPGPTVELPSAGVRERVIQQALAMVQVKNSTWTRSDLMKNLAWAMGQEFAHLPQDAWQGLLEQMTDQALGVEYGVQCVEAPEWPTVPRSLIRELDGRSVYTRPGVTRYATLGQLTIEQRMRQQAQAQGAPALAREFCAAQLGADADVLDAQLGARAQDATQLTQTGLRMDQAAMIYQALTSTRRVSVGVGPAGAGKTHTAATGARAWEAAGGEVVGLTCAQAASNVLHAAGIKECYNTSRFLRSIDCGSPIRPGTLFVIDEGSMVSMNHLARLIDLAEWHGGKVFLTGDHGQLTAVESGGGMRMLAAHLGYTQLAVPVRFTAEWERDASLRLRQGDKSALEAYTEHGRIIGASREQALDTLRQRYVAQRLAGEGALLMAYERQDCRELSRLIRDDLIHLGHVDAGPSIEISEGQRASAGDVIVCRENDSRAETDPGHKLTNGDIFHVESVGENGAWVRRVLGNDRETGQVRLADHAFFYGEDKLRTVTDLGYAVTGHKGMGGTVRNGSALVTGTEPREWLYVAMTRGTDDNTAVAITHEGVKQQDGARVAIQPREADPQPGTRADPELARRERLDRERAGLPPQPAEQPDDEVRDPVVVLADCLDREDAELSASDYRQRALSNADHLAVLHARWADLAGQADRERYHQLVNGALPDEYRHDDLGPKATWLWRDLRATEMAGLDPAEVARAAVNSNTLAGVRSIAGVLHTRMEKIVKPLVPIPQKPWTDRSRQFGDPQIAQHEADLRQAMDERADRLGQHAVETSPAWAVQALGPVPEDPVARLDWQQRASTIATYRELYGVGDNREVIGREPTENAPEMRAAWHDAFAAITRTDGVDVRELPDSSLQHMRDSYKSETGWAPPHVGKQLRDVRLAAGTMRLKAIRAEEEARLAKDQALAARHEEIVATARELEAEYRARETLLGEVMQDRDLWDKLTEGGRRLAVQADLELRRRYPGRKIRPMESAEPQAPEGPAVEPGWLAELEEQRRVFREEAEARQNVMVPAEDPDWEDEGPAWRVWEAQRDAILQPPKPEILPADAVLEAAFRRDAQQRDTQPEAEPEAV